jgi:hypothetical protein
MAITTLSNVKTLLGLSTGTADDSRISALITQVEQDYQAVRGKPFDVGTKLTVETTGLPVDETVTIEIGAWEYDIDLVANDTAPMIARRIVNQIKPNTHYTIFAPHSTSTSANVYFVEKMEAWSDDYSVLDLSITNSANITATVAKMEIIYPDGAEMTAAQMVGYQMLRPNGVQSESLGDYSVSYGTIQGGYPAAITSKIVRFAVTG